MPHAPAAATSAAAAEFRLAPSGFGSGLFFEDFDARGVPEAAPEQPPPSFTEAELVAACDACRNEGLRQGLEQARVERAEATGRSLDAIAAGIGDASAAGQAAVETHAGEVARLLLATLGRLLPDLCARFGAGEVAAMAQALQPALRHQPCATVRVHPDSAAAVTAALAARDPALAALRVEPAAAIAPGDARVEWQDGAAVRDAAALWRSVAAVLAPLDLAAPAAAAPPVRDPAVRDLAVRDLALAE